ncbi:MAG: division plane positioning ATPase MipZ, partial [Alphaproteobacteria bacterium]|nr:division plane positioning ATPase MipZ [Alphaproteobacteria bacterium]
GFAERVIFRELFLHGLCVLDAEGTGPKPTKSHLAAIEEVRGLAAKIDELSRPQATGRTTAAGD